MHEAGAYPGMSREGGVALEVTENMHFYFLNMSIIPFFFNYYFMDMHLCGGGD